MSKELIGKNGKIVGSLDYFNKLNDKCGMENILNSYKFDYYSRLKAKSYKANRMFDEVFMDLKNNEQYLSYIDKDNKKVTAEIIKGMAGVCKIVGDSTSGADKCVTLLLHSDKSKSGASDNDITKSAKYVLSNKYFNKQESIKIIEYCVKNGENKALASSLNTSKFINEAKRSSKSGFWDDVLLKVKYINEDKDIKGICGKLISSKEYNNYVACAVTRTTSSVSKSGNVDYGRIVSQGLRYVVVEAQKDLEKGLRDNDYILDENKGNLIKYIEDFERCNSKCYNLIKMVYELAWFVGGDENKIKKLQATLNRQGYSKVVQDGVYGDVTEEAWIDYVNKTLKPYERYDDFNVVGIGVQGSAHFMGGANVGLTIYVDDDFNIVLMGSFTLEAGTGLDASVGANIEWSRTAKNVKDMEGKSVTTGIGGNIPIVGVVGNLGHSVASGSITSDSIGIGKSLWGDLEYGISGGFTYNVPLFEFNPKEWIRGKLKIN